MSKEDTSHNAPYIDKPSIIRNIKYFSELAKENIDKLQPNKLQEFLIYLIDEIKFDSNKMKTRILGHIPVTKKTDDSDYDSLFHFPTDLMGETRNKFWGSNYNLKWSQSNHHELFCFCYLISSFSYRICNINWPAIYIFGNPLV